MKFNILILFFLFTLTSFSQTLHETTDWISRTSNGSQQVIYDDSENVLKLIKTQPAMIYVSEIDPQKVSSIDISYGKEGWNSVSLNFKSGGANVKSYFLNSHGEIDSEIINSRMSGYDVSIETSKTQIEKFKKAYMHLFKTIGAPVKDGDMF